jgi:hypothetical protein
LSAIITTTRDFPEKRCRLRCPRALFLKGTSPWLQVPVNALLGPLVALISFVCSIANVPMAAVLWAPGSGVLSFLYADLIVLPLLDAYRRYYGWRMAAYIAIVFYVTMVLAGLVMDLAFTAAGLVPERNSNIRAEPTSFSFNYTFWLNIAFGLLAAYFVWVNWKHTRWITGITTTHRVRPAAATTSLNPGCSGAGTQVRPMNLITPLVERPLASRQRPGRRRAPRLAATGRSSR